MNVLLSQLMKTSPELEISIQDILLRVGNSIALSILLILATYLLSSQHRSPKSIKNNLSQTQIHIQLLLGLSNLLFLCVGLTGIMLLINNNIIRAFSIVAAIALVRFRIKVDQNNPNASYLFAVLAGMSSGLGETAIAWTMTGVYCCMLLVITLAAVWIKRGDKKTEPSALKTVLPGSETATAKS